MDAKNADPPSQILQMASKTAQPIFHNHWRDKAVEICVKQ